MRSRIAWVAGALGVAGAFAYRALRRRPQGELAEQASADARAEELRRKLAEARELAHEREEFESAETPVDRAQPADAEVGGRRRQVHEQGRAAAEEMQRSSPGGG